MEKNILLTNGKIFTADDRNLFVSEMAIKNGRIMAVGEEIVPTEWYKIIDLKGKTVIPGLIDAHKHPVTLAEFPKRIAVLSPNIF